MLPRNGAALLLRCRRPVVAALLPRCYCSVGVGARGHRNVGAALSRCCGVAVLALTQGAQTVVYVRAACALLLLARLRGEP
eukprot:3979586-Alexandrium_andersonii.AAC.1